MSNFDDDTPNVPGPSIWPIGFAVGIACLLVGLVISIAALIVGAVIAAVTGALWVRELTQRREAPPPPPDAEERAAERAAAEEALAAPETFDRGLFLGAATVGLGGLIGAAVTLPSVGFMVLPSFMGDGVDSFDVDLGPISNFPVGKYVVTTYIESPDQGEVSRRTAFVRNNGPTSDGLPSFSIVFSRCVHLGCPVQPNGPTEGDEIEYVADGRPPVTLQPVLAASFGCPCHGGLYDGEGNRTAGPPVRALDRYEFSIVDGNLILGRLFSVGEVEGTGANAQISKYYRAYPGVHVDGVSRFLYPIPTPGSKS